MSIVIVLAPGLAMLTVAFTYAAVYSTLKWFRIRPSIIDKPAIVAAIVAIPVLTIANFYCLLWTTTKSELGVSASQANKSLMSFKLPAEASDVDYRHTLFKGTVDVAEFAISERAFISWATKNGWKIRGFSHDGDVIRWAQLPGPNPGKCFGVLEASFPLAHKRERHLPDVSIDRGYYFDDYDPYEFDDSGLTVAYDLDTERAYILTTKF